MSSIPSNPSDETKRRNPHLFGPQPAQKLPTVREMRGILKEGPPTGHRRETLQRTLEHAITSGDTALAAKCREELFPKPQEGLIAAPASPTSVPKDEKAWTGSEKVLQEAICQLLIREGIHFIVRSRTDRATSNNVGCPDLLFVRKGIPCAWEIKTAKGKLSHCQVRALERMRADGWRTAVVKSIEQAGEELKAITP